MKKNILFITHSANITGGAEDDFQRIIAYFSEKQNYNVHVLTPTGDRYDLYSEYSEKIGIYKQGWFPVMTSSIYGYLKYIIIGIYQMWEMKKFIVKTRYDYTVINVSVLFFPILLIKLLKIKSVVFIRETISSDKIRKIYYKFFKKLANYFIGVSNFNSDDFRKFTGLNNTMVLYSSIEVKSNRVVIDDDGFINSFKNEVTKELNNEDNFKLLLNGNVCERKNQLLALKALNILINELKQKNYKLYLAGDIIADKNYLNTLQNYIESNKLDNYCCFLGSQPKSVIYKLYEKIDLTLITSLSEGLPLVLVESFCYKKPVISTNVGGIAEVINNGKNGYLINGFSEIDIAEKIIELKNDKLLYEKLSDNCFITFKKLFNLESNLLKLEKLLNSL